MMDDKEVLGGTAKLVAGGRGVVAVRERTGKEEKERWPMSVANGGAVRGLAQDRIELCERV